MNAKLEALLMMSVLLTLLNLYASAAIAIQNELSRGQRVKRWLVTWCLPFVGAWWVLRQSRQNS